MTNPIPLLFEFPMFVIGRGFLAAIHASGRALMTEEDFGSGTEYWLAGVNPAGFAGGGRDRETAYRELHVSFQSVFMDLAQEADDFDAFKAAANRFFTVSDAPAQEEWMAAVQRCRQTKERVPGLRTVHGDLAMEAPKLEIRRLVLDQLQPDLNVEPADAKNLYRRPAA